MRLSCWGWKLKARRDEKEGFERVAPVEIVHDG